MTRSLHDNIAGILPQIQPDGNINRQQGRPLGVGGAKLKPILKYQAVGGGTDKRTP